MIFVTGGCSSGKRYFVQSTLGYSVDEFTEEFLNDKKVFYNLHLKDCTEQALLFDYLRTKDVIICDEIGSGIIPLQREDRIHREQVGRICCKIAQESTEVYRVCAGIGVKIK